LTIRTGPSKHRLSARFHFTAASDFPTHASFSIHHKKREAACLFKPVMTTIVASGEEVNRIVIRRLIEDDESEMDESIFIDDLREPVFSDLLQAMKRSRVRKLSLCRYLNPRWRRHARMDLIRILFQEMRKLNNLVSLRICEFGGNEEGLAELLYRHPTLERVELQCLRAIPSNVVEALVTIPNLTEVACCLGDSVPLSKLLDVKSLKHLEVIDFDEYMNGFREEHLLDILEAISRSTTLTSVYLGEFKSPELVHGLAEMIRINKSIISLEVDFSGGCEKEVDSFCCAISNSLKVNKTIQTFVVYPINMAPTQIGETGREAILNMLEHNTSLVFLDFMFDEHPHEDNEDADEDDMSCDTDDGMHTDDFKLKKDNFLKMNELGREHLLTKENAHKSEWIRFMDAVRDDLDCLFYLVRANPMICRRGCLVRSVAISTNISRQH
jgi:hypothetical protein